MGVKVSYKGNQIASMDGSGTKTLKTAGNYCDGDIAVQYEKPTASEVTSGAKSITANGSHDVTAYKTANVNVPIPSGYIKPSGSKSITENGTHDVTSYASVEVNVASGGTTATKGKVFEKVIAESDVKTGYAWVTLVDADADILAHKDDATLAVSFYRTTTVEGSCILGGIQRSNALAYDGKTGSYIRQTSASAGSPQSLTAGLRAGTSSTGVMHVTDAGEVKIYQATSYPMKAGTYKISVMW